MSVHIDPPGSFARFDITRTLGRGGMGVVYEAIDRERNLQVALKMLPRVEPEALLRFKQEFRLLAGLSHPNLAALYELISSDDQWGFTMELVEGSDFLGYVRERGGQGATARQTHPSEADTSALTVGPPASDTLAAPARPAAAARGGPIVDLPRLRAALRQLASALVTLHAHRRLHCDIKPSNVLVTRDGRVVVLDFGLATDIGRVQHGVVTQGLVYGTAAYMAPEQAAGSALTPACDWYAVGSMLFEALTGTRPFQGSSYEMLIAKQTAAPPDPRLLDPRIPEALGGVCARLLTRSPHARANGLDLLEAIGASAIPASVTTADADSGLVGRERHVATLQTAFNEASAGHAASVFLSAPSGAGKSALLEHASARFSRQGAIVIAGRCFEQESVQYKALDSLIDGLSRHLASLPDHELRRVLPADAPLLAGMFPVLERLAPVAAGAPHRLAIASRQELRDRATVALRRLLDALATTRPLVLVIDDLQWGDTDSAAILLGLLAPPSPPPLLLLGAFRREYADVSPCLRALLGAPADAYARREVAVDPLTPDEARQLATRLLGGDLEPGAALAGRIAHESGGNPYFVQALVEHVRAEAQFSTAEVLAEGISLDEVLRRRTSRLRPPARRLLEAVALAGRPLHEADAYAAADLDTRDPSHASTLRNANLIRGGSAEGTLETYHDRIRESVVGHLAATNLRHLHQRLAQTLHARGDADPEWLAAHYHGAGDLLAAARHYTQAADGAARALAFGRAAELYGRSLDLSADDPAIRQPLRLQLAEALANGGRCLEAADVYQAAAREATGVESLELERKAGYQFCIGGSVRTGRSVLEGNLAKIGIRVPRSARRAISSLLIDRARLRWMEWTGQVTPATHAPAPTGATLERLNLLWATAASLYDVDTPVAGAIQARHLVEAIRAREPNHVAAALALQAAFASVEAGAQAAARIRRLLHRARRFADAVATPYARAMVRLAESNVAWWIDYQWDEALSKLDEAEDLLRRHGTGVIWELSLVHNHRVHLLRTRGHYAQLLRFGSAVLAEARQRRNVYLLARVGILIEPDARIIDGDPDGARRVARSIRASWLRREYPAQRLLSAFAEIEVDIYKAHYARALRRMQRYWRPLQRSQFLHVELVRVFAHGLRAGLALAAIDECPGDTAALLRVASRDIVRLERERSGRARATIQVVRAAMAVRQGKREEGLALLTSAIDWYHRSSFDAYEAAGRYYLGLLRGDDDGRQAAADALGWFATQGIREPVRVAAIHLIGFPASAAGSGGPSEGATHDAFSHPAAR